MWGGILSDQEAISSAFSDFFRNLMRKATPNLDVGIDWKLYYPVESRMPLASLEETFAKEEICTAVYSLRADKARGSGGYNMRFYQHFWQILREYFIDIFQAFYEGHLDISCFNRAYIALVPKIAGARRIGYFRPISLINGIIKIISKVFIGRLKKKINDLIDPSQSAFLMVAQFWIVCLLPKKLFQLAPDTISLTTFLNWTLLKLLTRLIDPLSSKFSMLMGSAIDGVVGSFLTQLRVFSNSYQ